MSRPEHPGEAPMQCDMTGCEWKTFKVGEVLLSDGGTVVLALCSSHIEMEGVLSWR